ncbi:MAG: chemotaxis protein methyltransferase CheR [Nitrospinales bacterium]|jgi:chemotaxis protein methyltransferase CheR
MSIAFSFEKETKWEIETTMDEKVFQTIKDLISTKTGIQVKDESENELAQEISVRMKYLKLSHPFEYQQILKANGVTSEIEWKELITFITTGESYFFRDKGQIDLLKTSILPSFGGETLWLGGSSHSF